MICSVKILHEKHFVKGYYEYIERTEQWKEASLSLVIVVLIWITSDIDRRPEIKFSSRFSLQMIELKRSINNKYIINIYNSHTYFK